MRGTVALAARRGGGGRGDRALVAATSRRGAPPERGTLVSGSDPGGTHRSDPARRPRIAPSITCGARLDSESQP